MRLLMKWAPTAISMPPRRRLAQVATIPNIAAKSISSSPVM